MAKKGLGEGGDFRSRHALRGNQGDGAGKENRDHEKPDQEGSRHGTNEFDEYAQGRSPVQTLAAQPPNQTRTQGVAYVVPGSPSL